MSQAVQEPEGGIDNTLASAFAQVRQQLAAAEGAEAPEEATTIESAPEAPASAEALEAQAPEASDVPEAQASEATDGPAVDPGEASPAEAPEVEQVADVVETPAADTAPTDPVEEVAADDGAGPSADEGAATVDTEDTPERS